MADAKELRSARRSVKATARPKGAGAGFILNPTLRLGAVVELCTRAGGRVKKEFFESEDVRRLQCLRPDPSPRPRPSDLKWLSAQGVYGLPAELPREVNFECRLEPDADLSLVPYLDEQGPVPPSPKVVLSSRVWLQREGRAPAAIRSRLKCAEALMRHPPSLWVEDPGLETLAPYWLTGQDRERLTALVDGKMRPSELPRPLVERLWRAQVLVRPGWERARQLEWERESRRQSRALMSDQYVVLRGLLNPLQVGAVRRYFRKLEREGYLQQGDSQTRRRNVWHNEPMSRFLHHQMVRVFDRITPVSIKASYSFLSAYKEYADLPRHRDREQCAWNVSLALDADRAPELSDAWPIYVEVQGEAREIRLRLGDAVLYQGAALPHWRDPLPAGRSTTMGLFHFVERSFHGSLD